MEYVEKLARNPVAVSVKLADLQDNMNPMRPTAWDETAERRLKKHQEAFRYLIKKKTQE